MTLYRRKEQVFLVVHRAHKDFAITCDGGVVRGKAGDYPVKVEDGCLARYRADEFLKEFEAVTSIESDAPELRTAINTGCY